jgi:hypothetical protein
LRAFGIGQPPFIRPSSFPGRIGRPFRREDIRTLAQYLRRFRHLSTGRGAPRKLKGAYTSPLPRPRLRAPREEHAVTRPSPPSRAAARQDPS